MTVLALALLVLGASTVRVRASCAYGTHLHAREEGGAVAVNTFGYTGTISPLNWLSLDPVANIACATGKTQSPIDMTAGQFSLVSAADVQLTIPDIAETEFENLGTTVEVVVPPGASMVANGTAFELKQFHFHLPSEHLDNGRTFAMEMHMVFESASKEIAVLGVYLDTANGAAVPAAAPPAPAAERRRRHPRDTAQPEVVGGVPARTQSIVSGLLRLLGVDGSGSNSAPASAVGRPVGVATGATGLVDTVFASVGNILTPGSKTKIGPLVMSGLVQSLAAGSLQTYAGSLTTPPCSEGVRWFVSTEKQTVSLPTFEAARDVIGFNSRFPQNALGQENVLALAVAANNAVAAGTTAATAAAAAA